MYAAANYYMYMHAACVGPHPFYAAQHACISSMQQLVMKLLHE
jgi:hypothetical protein